MGLYSRCKKATAELSGVGCPERIAARDKASGEVWAEIPLPGRAIGAPMSYEVGGRQHIAVTVRGARGNPPELVALAVP